MFSKYTHLKTVTSLILILILSILGSCKLIDAVSSEPTEKIAAETLPQSETTQEPEAFYIDINNDNGRIIKIIIRLINHEENLGALIEEFNMMYNDGEFVVRMFTLTDEYKLSLVVPHDIDREIELDYGAMKLKIENVTENWTLENPTQEQVDVSMLQEYYAQREEWKEQNIQSEYNGNFLEIYPPSQPAVIIAIDDVSALQITEYLRNSTEHVIINDTKGTENEYAFYGVSIFLEGMYYQYPTLIWVNSFGKTAFGFANEPIPVSEQAADIVFGIIDENMDFEKIPLSEIKDIVSVELLVDGVSKGIVADKKDVLEIQNILSSAVNCGGPTKCPFATKLVLTKSDGSKIELVHATDGCLAFAIGTADYYKYDNEKNILSYFSMSD